VIVAFIDAYKLEFGVEPICRVLRDHNVPIAPSTYYAFKKRPPSARAVSDERLVSVVKAVHEDNFGVYGSRKMWHALKRKGEQIGRDQVARLMRLAGVRGVSRRKRTRPSAPLLPEVRSPDLVRRAWFRDAPDLVWVADFTHVHTREGWMYVSFLQDAFSRRILGFTVAASKTVELVTRTLLQAVSVRRRSNVDFVAEGVIAHSDAGSQYTSLAFTEKLLDLGIAGSVGRVGTAYDNALMESTIGLYKTELVHRRATGWDGREELELATARWVAWFNRDRLHEMLGYFTPIEIEEAYVHQQGLPRQAA
jgi:transposase InsO family protein